MAKYWNQTNYIRIAQKKDYPRTPLYRFSLGGKFHVSKETLFAFFRPLESLLPSEILAKAKRFPFKERFIYHLLGNSGCQWRSINSQLKTNLIYSVSKLYIRVVLIEYMSRYEGFRYNGLSSTGLYANFTPTFNLSVECYTPKWPQDYVDSVHDSHWNK